MTAATGFDPDAFLHAQYEEECSTRSEPLPEGEYIGTITKLEAATTRNGTPLLEVFYAIEHPELEEELGRAKSQVRQSVWLDLTEAGDLDFSKGKNIQLGRLRAAAGQNVSGQPWSPSDLEGASVRVRVKHRLDKNDPDIKYEEVKGVSAL